ncbi:hypothetical protein ElyMa_005449100 [Elysia marginata]|uniref:CC domain-containing protein n=1 Tax=Elysia marginata TaxID=1093978 RepID=A0AAV4EP41_9GAST|nr:hypothetical protein ElyMa_005449100 [Elysia marginata]
MFGTVLLMLTVLVGSGCLVESRQRFPDPRCVSRRCPAGTTCRVVNRCSTPVSCRLVAECLANPPYSHQGVCKIGAPILIQVNGTLRDTQCGPGLFCPGGTYCNSLLQDTYATCCLSDPGTPQHSANATASSIVTMMVTVFTTKSVALTGVTSDVSPQEAITPKVSGATTSQRPDV